jgi:hypothetical protein
MYETLGVKRIRPCTSREEDGVVSEGVREMRKIQVAKIALLNRQSAGE